MDWTVASVIRRHAGRGDAPMIRYGDRVISWAEMQERSSQVAQALAAEGVGSQDRVAIIDKNGPEYFETLFGAGKLNAITVGVNWRLAPPEMEYTINDAEARVLIVGQDFVGHLDQFEAGLQSVKRIVVLGGHRHHEAYEDWLAGYPALDPMAPVAPDDVALQLYTSGTTGLPKGAMSTNANLGVLLPLAPQWKLDESSVNLVAMPLFHIAGSAWALAGMGVGCESVLVREINPPELLETIQRERVTNAVLVPALLQFLTALPAAEHGDFRVLRAIAYGASPITDEVLVRSLRTFGCDFFQVYGLTETTGAITQLDPADHDPGGPRARLLRSVGRPYSHIELKVVDPQTGEERPPGEVGELWTRSAQNMKGYWNKPEETAEATTPDGWFKTGDAGYCDDEGYVFLTDRIKDMIVSGGENIYPIEVENVLAAHPAVADIAVIGVPDARWGETVKAIVVLREGHSTTSGELISFARQRLAGFKCPSSIDFTSELPRNPSGKLLKRELREPYWEGHERRIH